MKCENCGATLTSPTGVSLTICPFCNADNNTITQAAASEAEAALREEFLRRGESLYRDKRVLGALIGDFFAENRKLLRILRLAIQDNIAVKIADLSAYSVSEQKMRISSIISYFANDYDMSKIRATEAVRVLALGAGVAEEVFAGLAQASDKSARFLNATPASNMHTTPNNSPKPQLPPKGSIYHFGGYDWRVLEIQGYQALLLSAKVLEKRSYNITKGDITWEHCTLRKYLNSDFYNKLPATDKKRITQRTILNNDNPWFRTKGGLNTPDKVFLLSIEEVVKYLGNNNLSRSKMSLEEKKYWDVDICEAKGAPTWLVEDGYPGLSFFMDFCGNQRCVAKNVSATASWWWLRSPGGCGGRAAGVGGTGSVGVFGSLVIYATGGVRPALWLKL